MSSHFIQLPVEWFIVEMPPAKQGGGRTLLLTMGIVIAKSFARIFYRNSINIGLPVIVCKDLYDHIEDGDQMELSLTDGIASVNGQKFVCTKLPPYMQNILDQGGLIASLNKEED